MAQKKTISMKQAVQAFLVMSEDEKSIDLDATKSKFGDYLVKHNASVAAEQELITKCVHDLFDTYKGSELNMDYITSQTVEKMKKLNPDLGDPTLFSFLSKRIKEVMGELTGEDVSKPFAIKRGPKGGHFKKADQKQS